MMLAALRHRDYRLLWVGQGVSFLGDQFHLVALPWLVLQLTGDPIQLGLVMATAGVPRAVFMLVGGAWADRHSPRKIMLVSDVIRFAVTGYIAVTILLGTIQMWEVYLLALVFGTVSGFFTPAADASVPRLLEDSELESGNALMRIAESSASFVGPAAAGILIAAFGTIEIAGEAAGSLVGIGIAQLINALSFAVSALCLVAIHQLPSPEHRPESRPARDIVEGLRFAWRSRPMRTLFILITTANLFIAGPLVIGLPVLAEARLGGAIAFGLILSAFAAGNLGGMGLAGSLKRPSPRVLRVVIVAVFAVFGLAIGALAFVDTTWQAVPLMVLAGLVNGYVSVTFTAQLQRLSPRRMLGRVMGLMLLTIYGLRPVSETVAGWVSARDSTVLFLGAGAGLLAISVAALLIPGLHEIGSSAEEPSPEPAADQLATPEESA